MIKVLNARKDLEIVCNKMVFACYTMERIFECKMVWTLTGILDHLYYNTRIEKIMI